LPTISLPGVVRGSGRNDVRPAAGWLDLSVRANCELNIVLAATSLLRQRRPSPLPAADHLTPDQILRRGKPGRVGVQCNGSGRQPVPNLQGSDRRQDRQAIGGSAIAVDCASIWKEESQQACETQTLGGVSSIPSQSFRTTASIDRKSSDPFSTSSMRTVQSSPGKSSTRTLYALLPACT